MTSRPAIASGQSDDYREKLLARASKKGSEIRLSKYPGADGKRRIYRVQSRPGGHGASGAKPGRLSDADMASISAANMHTPAGYSVRAEGSILVLSGPFSRTLHADIKAIGGRWDGKQGENRRVWMVPAGKGLDLERVLWERILRERGIDRETSSPHEVATQWLHFLEASLHDGTIEPSHFLEAQPRVTRFEDLAPRFDDLVSRYDLSTSAPGFHSMSEEEVAERVANRSIVRGIAPALREPAQLGDRWVVYEFIGIPFNLEKRHWVREDGTPLPGVVTGRAQFAYHRPATHEEISACQASVTANEGRLRRRM
ncbi:MULTISPECIES: hypothetical protein [unclassified Thioalkalivibrio]|uniref:hypothetical protein n=1 Tax=unclassified Thioalkalivibrio TaxID=2621013 RepID=UPI00035D3592|nr:MULTISPECIES: hypothetical protein [unclassified Thioalkalivibrio]